MQLTQLTPSASAQNPSIFKFGQNEIRVFERNKEPWFVATDIAKCLGIKNPKDAVKNLRQRERWGFNPQRGGSLTLVSESGLYTMILRSDSAIKDGTPAFNFRVWVTDDLLPTLRKTGSYSCPTATITPEQQLAIQQAVGRRAQKTANHYQTIYRAIKLRYQIARYDQLPQDMFEDCLRFIETMDLHTPEVVTDEVAQPLMAKDSPRYLTDAELSSLQRIHSLHKDPYFKIAYDVAFATLSAARSKYAGRFFDVMTENSLAISRVGKILDRNEIEHF